MKTKSFFLGLFLLFSISAFAQVKVHVGATTTGQMNFVLDKGLKSDPRYVQTNDIKFAPIGLAFGVDLTDNFGLQLESIYSIQGAYYQVVDIYETVQGYRDFEANYIHLPVLLKFMSASVDRTRFNFMIGPQLSFLTSGSERIKYDASQYYIPEGVTPPEGAEPVPGEDYYNVPATDGEIVLFTTEEEIVREFKEAEFQIAASMGFDIDIARNLSISTQLRMNYAISDFRNEDFIQHMQEQKYDELYERRSSLLVGVQIGVNYVFGGTRFFTR
ncbi:outer membrane beta-barrel protein [Mangrovivirga sp. M17]|uniref:Outer membrane beta-barrel protein n=1 Tax=Mangrovivirga halotolerans TaxID=2993936 RepID=A0ABT3RP55_9BACT|nr:outer membrane beta-barrel protein [Mangrovivirga halotolerans]MCX2742945.1 outer membrane beta-barrel protein [Mangrovivirga halotolerans]